MRALIIWADGSIAETDALPEDDREQGPWMRQTMNSEALSLIPLTGVDFWLDPAAALDGIPNGRATRLARSMGYRGETVFGPVIITGHRDSKTIALDRYDSSAIREVALSMPHATDRLALA